MEQHDTPTDEAEQQQEKQSTNRDEKRMQTKKQLEDKFEQTYYFKLEEQNPLTLREAGQTIRLGRKQMKIQATGQVELEDEKHGFLAGKEVEE